MLKTTAEEKKARRHAYYLAHKDEIYQRAIAWKKMNREKVLAGNKVYKQKNAYKISEGAKQYYERHAELSKRNYLARRGEFLAKAKKYYKSNKAKANASAKAYRAANRGKIRDTDRAYRKRRLATDIAYRLKQACCRRMHNALNGKAAKSARTLELLGCSGEFLRGYLEARFKVGMSWENYGSWHIDHINPLARFDLTQPEQQRIAFHYTNLQPLWAIDNRMKSARLDWETIQ